MVDLFIPAATLHPGRWIRAVELNSKIQAFEWSDREPDSPQRVGQEPMTRRSPLLIEKIDSVEISTKGGMRLANLVAPHVARLRA
jgi:hypothetical protein